MLTSAAGIAANTDPNGPQSSTVPRLATTVVPTMIVQPAPARGALNGGRAGRQPEQRHNVAVILAGAVVVIWAAAVI